MSEDGDGGRSGRARTGRQSRRGFVRSLAVAGVAGLAGCNFGGSGSPTDASTPTDTTAPESDSPTPSPTAGVVTSVPAGTPETTGTASATATPATTVAPGEVSVPTATGGSLRERVARVGAAIRPAVGLFDSAAGQLAGTFLDPSLVVTAGSALPVGAGGERVVQTFDGRSLDATVLGRVTPDDGADDVGALRVGPELPTFPEGSAADLSADDVVVSVAHRRFLGEWLVQFGRVQRWTEGDEQFVTSLPIPTPGSPVVTLDGRLVGITTRRRFTDQAATRTPPPTEPPTVYTDRNQWAEVRHEPLPDVRARVDEWTE